MRQIDTQYGFSPTPAVLNRPRAEVMSRIPGIAFRRFGTLLKVGSEAVDADKENKGDSLRSKPEREAFWGVLQRDIAVWDVQQIRRIKTEQALTRKERRKLDRRERKLEEVIVSFEREIFERLDDAKRTPTVLGGLSSIIDEAQQIGEAYLSTRPQEDNGLNAFGRWFDRSIQRRKEGDKHQQQTATYL